MSLDPYDVALYLSDRGLVNLGAVVEGDFMVLDQSRRNRNLRILRRRGPSLFLKQVRDHNPARLRTLEREAACYRLARDDPRFAGLGELMPGFRHFDRGRHILIIDLLSDSEDLWRRHLRLKAFPVDLGRLQGELLGRYHRSHSVDATELQKLGVFDQQIPWILSVHRTDPGYFRQLSGGNAQLVAILQQYPDFQKALDRLSRSWKHRALIHGDIKWENLVATDDGSGTRLRLIDWEMADVGDECWDLGAVLQSYLTFWIFQLPLTQGKTIEQATAESQFDEEQMKPAMAAYWTSYADIRELGPRSSKRLLERSMRCAAARMIQTAYEGIQNSSQITPHALCQLQMSMNILRDPDQAIDRMIGL